MSCIWLFGCRFHLFYWSWVYYFVLFFASDSILTLIFLLDKLFAYISSFFLIHMSLFLIIFWRKCLLLNNLSNSLTFFFLNFNSFTSYVKIFLILSLFVGFILQNLYLFRPEQLAQCNTLIPPLIFKPSNNLDVDLRYFSPLYHLLCNIIIQISTIFNSKRF